MKSEDAINCIWKQIFKKENLNINQVCGDAVEALLCNAILTESTDNITAVILTFKESFNPSKKRESLQINDF